MLRLDLVRLGREGSARVDVQIPADDPLWEGLEATFAGPVAVRFTATFAGSGEVVVRGTVRAELQQECRRCLEPVRGDLDETLTLVFVPSDEPGVEEDGDVRLFDGDGASLDLSDAVREEVALSIDLFVVCDPECKGLCPQCGTNLNQESCSCTVDEPDPRWDALRALKEE